MLKILFSPFLSGIIMKIVMNKNCLRHQWQTVLYLAVVYKQPFLGEFLQQFTGYPVCPLTRTPEKSNYYLSRNTKKYLNIMECFPHQFQISNKKIQKCWAKITIWKLTFILLVTIDIIFCLIIIKMINVLTSSLFFTLNS